MVQIDYLLTNCWNVVVKFYYCANVRVLLMSYMDMYLPIVLCYGITQYSSTVYIGIAMVLYSPHTLGNSIFAFTFKSIRLVMSLYCKAREI